MCQSLSLSTMYIINNLCFFSLESFPFWEINTTVRCQFYYKQNQVEEYNLDLRSPKPMNQTSNCKPFQILHSHTVLSRGRGHSNWIQKPARSPLLVTPFQWKSKNDCDKKTDSWFFSTSERAIPIWGNEEKMVSSSYTLFHLILAAALWYTYYFFNEKYEV